MSKVYEVLKYKNKNMDNYHNIYTSNFVHNFLFYQKNKNWNPLKILENVYK